MARSTTFIIEGDVNTQVRITENADGTLTFEIEVLGSGLIGDLRALFFDLHDLNADDGLTVYGTTDVTDSAFAEAGVDTLGRDANIKGSVVNELGDFDVGIEFGTSGIGEDDIQSTSFTLAHDTLALKLDMIDLADFGLRYTSVGEVDGTRNGSLKIGDQASGVADNDALEVEENSNATVDLLVNDTGGDQRTVTGAHDADGAFSAVAGGFARQVVVGGAHLGTVTVGTDGIAAFSADGANVDGLALGETVSFAFSYETAAPDGSLATADVTLTVTGTNDAPVLANAALTAEEDGAAVTLDLSALGSDIDSDDDGASLTYSLVGGLVEGTASVNGSVLTFDPGADFQDLNDGESRDVLIQVQAEDSHGATATGWVTVTVTGQDDQSPPVARPDLTITDEETVLTGNLFADNTAGPDYDPDGHSFQVHTVDGLPAQLGVPVLLSSGAVLTLEANGDFTFDPRGAFDFVPEGGQSADGIWYTVIDSTGMVSNEVRANFSVQGVNDAPVIEANSDVFITIPFDAVIQYEPQYGTIPGGETLSGSFTVNVTTGEGVSIEVYHPTEGMLSSDNVQVFIHDNAFGGTTDAIAVAGYDVTGALGGVVPGLGSITVDLRGDTSILDGTSLPTDLATWNAFTGRFLGLPDENQPDATRTVGAVADFATADVTASDTSGTVQEGGSLTAAGAIGFSDADLTDMPVASHAVATIDGVGADGVTPLALSAAQVSAIASGFQIAPDPANTNSGTVDWSYVTSAAEIGFLDDGEVVTAVFTISVTDDHGASAAQDITVTITGQDEPLLFTAGDDTVDFNLVTAGDYADASQYDALDGNDVVVLASNAAAAAAAGYDPLQVFDAGAGDDNVTGGATDDTILGNAGRDILFGLAGDDILSGGDGNDNIVGGLGDDVLDGGTGSDILNYAGAGQAIVLDSATGLATGEGSDSFSGFEQYRLSQFSDLVTGSGAAEQFRLFGGDDVLDAGAGNDIVFGGAGDDTLEGGDGVDFVDYRLAAAGVSVSLTAGTASGGEGNDQISGFESIRGSQHDDLLIGDDTDTETGWNTILALGGDDTVHGGGGDDWLEGNDGDDQVFGDAGDDIVHGGAGSDLMDGGAGSDTAYYADMTTSVTIDLALGVATQGTDTDALVSIENATGSRGDDTIVGDAGANVITGGLGNDVMMGGGGADRFVFDLRGSDDWGDDAITDFDTSLDLIRLIGSGFTSVSDLNGQQVGADVSLDLGNGTTLTLENIQLGDLGDGNFAF